MRVLIFIILAIGIGMVGAYFLSPEKNPVINKANPVSSQPEAQKHIQRLTSGEEKPIKITEASNFVTADQLLLLPDVGDKASSEIVIDNPARLAGESTTDAQGQTFAVQSHLGVIKPSKETAPANNQAIQAIIATQQIKLLELLDDPDDSSQKVYFIHAVNEGDDEGLWGIIQHGLINTFTSGLALSGFDNKVSVAIPKEADEALEDRRSSFLGQILKRKVDQTYIYNYEKGILGENPDLIKPGQQLVIVTFTEQELIGIYHHFVNL